MGHRSGVTVQDILQLDCMRQTKIVAGQRGLERIITNVNVMEVPDILEWVGQGELLLTTAYSIRNDVHAQATLVPELAAKGLAGLCLKLKRYLETIPPSMIEQANALNFPLLELPMETSFSEIINNILAEILEFQTLYLRKSEEAHRLFMEVMLKGGHIEELVNTLAKLIDNSVIVYDAKGDILTKSLVNWDEAHFCISSQKVSNLKSEVVDPLESGVKYDKRELTVDPPLHEFRTPIIGRGRTCGYLAIWDNNHTLTRNDFIFIDQAMTNSALVILNEKSLMEIERRYRNEFLDDLLSEQLGEINTRAFIARAHYLGWDLTQNYVAMVFDIDYFKEYAEMIKQDEQRIQHAKEKLFYYVLNCLAPGENYISGTKSDSIILLLAQPKGHDEKGLKKYFCRRADDLLQCCQDKIKDFTISLGVGRYYPGIGGLRKSYSEALKALSSGKSLIGQSKVSHFDDLGIYRLLLQVTNLDEVESFYRETILPLDLHDKHSNSNLVKTLSMYFECNCNLKQVSKKLFTHYNTVIYRMEQISQIIDLDMNLSENRLNLAIGLKIRQILKEKKII